MASVGPQGLQVQKATSLLRTMAGLGLKVPTVLWSKEQAARCGHVSSGTSGTSNPYLSESTLHPTHLTPTHVITCVHHTPHQPMKQEVLRLPGCPKGAHCSVTSQPKKRYSQGSLDVRVQAIRLGGLGEVP